MKNLGTIRVTQRTALGRDDSGTTRIYAYVYRPGLVRFVADEMPSGQGTTVLGYIDIIRPAVMLGGRDDVMGDYVRMCRKYLLAHPMPGMYESVCGDLCYEG